MSKAEESAKSVLTYEKTGKGGRGLERNWKEMTAKGIFWMLRLAR